MFLTVFIALATYASKAPVEKLNEANTRQQWQFLPAA